MSRARPVPSWVITDGYVDEELGTLRAGKEAGCFLVRRSAGERYCLLVRKDYRKRSDRSQNAPVKAGEWGIRSNAYRDSLVHLETRQRRAAANRSAFGKEVIEHAWVGREFATLRRLWEAGARVPYPVSESGHGFLMQYIGTVGAAAPRLADLRPTRDEASRLFDDLVDELRLFAEQGIVHGDLSAYNVLVQHGRPWVIDVPQSVDLYVHPRGFELFARDVWNLCDYFARRGVDCNARRVTDELLRGTSMYDADVRT